MAFNYDAFGSGGNEIGVFDSDVGGGVNGGRALAGGLVGALIYGDSAAAAIGTNSSARSAGSIDGEIGSIHNTTASGHDAARIIFAGSDSRIGNIDSGAIGSVVVCSGGATVTKDAVGTGGIGGDIGILDIERGATFG